MKQKLTAAALTLLLTGSLFLSGCSSSSKTVDLMKDVKAAEIQTDTALTEETLLSSTDFAVRLLQESITDKENLLISPLSLELTLTMTANGAVGDTLTQMEKVLGLPVSKLNPYLHAYTKQLADDEHAALHLANSIWLKEDKKLTVKPDFLQTNADYFQAGIYKAPFDDSTVNAINDWTSEHTKEMIPTLLDKIPDEAVMYLINALAFEADWEVPYTEDKVDQGTFTREDGTTEKVEYLHSSEYEYLKDGQASGFLKYYANGDYAFAALLPNEGISMEDYIASLTGEQLRNLLTTSELTTVEASIPKFEADFDQNMSETFQHMGMTDAFDYKRADFSNLGTSEDGNICIGRILHKTHISVTETGTIAGAASAAEMTAKMSMIPPEEIKTIRLDRPFLYMIIDCHTSTPVFLGVLHKAVS